MGSGWKFEVIQKTVRESENRLSVSALCDMAGVSRSGYYRWAGAAGVRESREQKDRDDFELVVKAYSQRGYGKGARGIYMCMAHWDPPVVMNLKKIRRLMDKYGLSCPVRRANPYRRMAKAIRTSHVADNILGRKFTEYGSRKVLLTDITYIPYNGTFACLPTILDAYTKQVLYYVLSDSLEVDFVLETVEKLVKSHGIELTGETLIHSNQGCHGFIFGRNIRNEYATWQFHLMEDGSASAYWGHYYMENKDAAVNDYNTRDKDAAPKRFKVAIIETLKMDVEVEAEDQEQAEQMVADGWKKGEYVLDADNFMGVEFEAACIDE